nr:BCCT family transporter [Rubrobacter indicoceani]
MRDFLKDHTNPPVFLISGAVALAVVLWVVLAPRGVSAAASVANSFITTNFEWLYIFGTSSVLVFVVGLLLRASDGCASGRRVQGPSTRTLRGLRCSSPLGWG